MFENLVESNPHTEDLKRKGSFLLGTVVLYAVLFIVGGVASIYWYDAHLENQNLELTTLVAPVPDPPQQAPEEQHEQPKPTERQQPEIAQRTELIQNINQTPVKVTDVNTQASRIPPIPEHGQVALGSSNREATATGPIGVGPGGGIPGGTGGPVHVEEEPPPPPPKPSPTPPRAPISGGVLNGKAISLPKPAYPPIARAAHAAGQVVVQVTIDENGNVISAHAVSGHPLLQQAAVQAAHGARFSPTKLSGQPVKVTGTIIYNFVAQ